MTSDRYGVYFKTGCRVWDIYTEKHGTVQGVVFNAITPLLSVLFDGDDKPISVRPVCLEIVGLGVTNEDTKKASKKKGEYVNA